MVPGMGCECCEPGEGLGPLGVGGGWHRPWKEWGLGAMMGLAVPKPASSWHEAAYSNRHGPEGSTHLFSWDAAGLCPSGVPVPPWDSANWYLGWGPSRPCTHSVLSTVLGLQNMWCVASGPMEPTLSWSRLELGGDVG